MNECFLGIDIGTGSSKGTIVDINGKVICHATIPHVMSSPHPGWYEQDADEIWWKDFTRLCGKLLKDFPYPSEAIKGVGVSTIAPCVLPVDKEGRPLRPGILYGIDTRASNEIREIEEKVGRKKIFSMTGLDLSSQSCCPKILWIRKNEPEVWKKTSKILTASGYLVFKLTNRYTLDYYNAVGYSPIFDIRNRKWDFSVADFITEPEKLPELLWSSEEAGVLTSEAALKTGLPKGIPVITGTADAASEAVGAGIQKNGDMMMMYGSSNFFILKTKALHPVPSLWATHFLEPGSFALTGGMSTVGSMFNWFNETFPGRSLQDWDNLANSSPPGADGIITLPYFAGERTPINDPKAKGVIFGLTLTTPPGSIFRSMQEAIGYGIRHNIEEMNNAGIHADRIFAIGGASKSKIFMQIVTDITGRPQIFPVQKLGACYGNAFLAAVGSRYFKNSGEIGEWSAIEEEITPNPKTAEVYTEGYEKYKELYSSTRHLL